MFLNSLQKLFDHSEEVVQSPHCLTNKQQILPILSKVQKEHCLLQARISGHAKTFMTAIIGINADTGIMALDEISPKEGHQLFLRHKSIQLSGILEGVELAFDLDLIAQRSQAGIAYYQVAIPESLTYLQRRDEYRVPLTGMPQFLGYLGEQTQQQFTGYATDLSQHGIGVELAGLETIQRGDELSACQLLLTDDEKLSFSLEVRFAQQATQRRTTHIGGRFIGLSVPDITRLAKLICQMERKLVKL